MGLKTTIYHSIFVGYHKCEWHMSCTNIMIMTCNMSEVHINMYMCLLMYVYSKTQLQMEDKATQLNSSKENGAALGGTQTP